MVSALSDDQISKIVSELAKAWSPYESGQRVLVALETRLEWFTLSHVDIINVRHHVLGEIGLLSTAVTTSMCLKYELREGQVGVIDTVGLSYELLLIMSDPRFDDRMILSSYFELLLQLPWSCEDEEVICAVWLVAEMALGRASTITDFVARQGPRLKVTVRDVLARIIDDSDWKCASLDVILRFMSSKQASSESRRIIIQAARELLRRRDTESA